MRAVLIRHTGSSIVINHHDHNTTDYTGPLPMLYNLMIIITLVLIHFYNNIMMTIVMVIHLRILAPGHSDGRMDKYFGQKQFCKVMKHRNKSDSTLPTLSENGAEVTTDHDKINILNIYPT